MHQPVRDRQHAEYLGDAIVHVIGLVAAVIAVPALLTFTAFQRDDPGALVATGIYGATLLAMILCSALYNMSRRSEWQPLLRRLDHAAIYFKIAGTYTAFALLAGEGRGLLAVLWTAAIAGTCLRVLAPGRLRALAIGLYLAMGWIAVIAGWPLMSALPGLVLGLIVTGGLIYTVGVFIYLSPRLPFRKAIWHSFVLTATGVFYVAVLLQVGQPPEG